jgi:hypothetical protein
MLLIQNFSEKLSCPEISRDATTPDRNVETQPTRRDARFCVSATQGKNGFYRTDTVFFYFNRKTLALQIGLFRILHPISGVFRPAKTDETNAKCPIGAESLCTIKTMPEIWVRLLKTFITFEFKNQQFLTTTPLLFPFSLPENGYANQTDFTGTAIFENFLRTIYLDKPTISTL